MQLTIILALITVIAMVVAVLTKPYVKIFKFNIGLYWIVCFIGAFFMLITGCIDFSTVISGVTANTSVNPLKILTLFLSMTLISIYLGDSGFFDYLANSVFMKSKGGGYKLFFILYAVVSVLTVFTSNDIIILTFTPPICIFAKKAKISPFPYLFGEFIAANTWSMALIVGNPTNVYLAQSAGVNFLEYLSVMALPGFIGGLTSLAFLLLVFRKQLAKPMQNEIEPLQPEKSKVRIFKTPMIVAIVHLVLAIILLAIADVIMVEMYLICLVLALSLTVFNIVYDLIKVYSCKAALLSIKKAPYELVPFVLSMFVIVLALKENGVTELIAKATITNTKLDCITFGFLSTFSANLLNNIPMSVLFDQIINGQNLYAVYGAIIGSNIGAFLTPVGALAGIMWSKILKNYEVNLSFRKFMVYGSAVAIPTLLLSVLTLALVV